MAKISSPPIWYYNTVFFTLQGGLRFFYQFCYISTSKYAFSCLFWHFDERRETRHFAKYRGKGKSLFMRRGSNRVRYAHSSPVRCKIRGARRTSPDHTSRLPPSPKRTPPTSLLCASIHASCFPAPRQTQTIWGENAAMRRKGSSP